jgi:hypothetical protein
MLRCGVLIALVLALSHGVAVAGDKEAMDAYKAGVAAVEGSRWREALSHLDTAAQARGQEGSFKIGVVTYDYLPSRYMAEAWLGLGDIPKARQALERAEGVKGASKADRAALVQLRQRIEAANPTPTAATAATASAATAPPAATAPAAKAPCPDLADANAALKAGDMPRARLLAARCLAAGEEAGARHVMDSVDAEVTGLLTKARREKAAGDTDQAASTIAKVLAIDSGNGEALDLRAALPAAAGSTQPRPGPSAATGPRTAASAPPGPTADVAVERGIRAFFEGNIAVAVASLEPRAESTTRADVLTAYACALATQSLVEGDSGQAEELAIKARAAWRRAKALRPGLRLDESTFSPRVRDLLGP